MDKLKNLLSVLFLLTVPSLPAATPSAWVATWTSSPQSAAPDPDEPLLRIDNQTVRERVRVSVGGDRIRIRLSNEYGSDPLLAGAVTVARPSGASSVEPASIRKVTFGGLGSVTIPAGAPVLSDPVAFPVAGRAEISISLYFPRRVATPSLHALALRRAIVSQNGDHTSAQTIEGGVVSGSSIAVTAVLVPAQPRQRLVVAFGDSFVDGDGSTPDADRGWPGDLIRRLAKSPADSGVAVVNEGIAGNRLLSDGSEFGLGVSALARFDRDVLALPGVTHVVLLEGLNDIGFPGATLGGRPLADRADARSTDELIGAYRQLISRAHVHGIKLIAATISPFESVTLPGYYSASKEVTRQAVNQWIRTSGEFDGVIDFDGVLRDPDHPGRMLPRLLSPDHLHPNDFGYQAMADAIDAALFQ